MSMLQIFMIRKVVYLLQKKPTQIIRAYKNSTQMLDDVKERLGLGVDISEKIKPNQ